MHLTQDKQGVVKEKKSAWRVEKNQRTLIYFLSKLVVSTQSGIPFSNMKIQICIILNLLSFVIGYCMG